MGGDNERLCAVEVRLELESFSSPFDPRSAGQRLTYRATENVAWLKL